MRTTITGSSDPKEVAESQTPAVAASSYREQSLANYLLSLGGTDGLRVTCSPRADTASIEQDKYEEAPEITIPSEGLSVTTHDFDDEVGKRLLQYGLALHEHGHDRYTPGPLLKELFDRETFKQQNRSLYWDLINAFEDARIEKALIKSGGDWAEERLMFVHRNFTFRPSEDVYQPDNIAWSTAVQNAALHYGKGQEQFDFIPSLEDSNDERLTWRSDKDQHLYNWVLPAVKQTLSDVESEPQGEAAIERMLEFVRKLDQTLDTLDDTPDDNRRQRESSSNGTNDKHNDLGTEKETPDELADRDDAGDADSSDRSETDSEEGDEEDDAGADIGGEESDIEDKDGEKAGGCESDESSESEDESQSDGTDAGEGDSESEPSGDSKSDENAEEFDDGSKPSQDGDSDSVDGKSESDSDGESGATTADDEARSGESGAGEKDSGSSEESQSRDEGSNPSGGDQSEIGEPRDSDGSSHESDGGEQNGADDPKAEFGGKSSGDSEDGADPSNGDEPQSEPSGQSGSIASSQQDASDTDISEPNASPDESAGASDTGADGTVPDEDSPEVPQALIDREKGRQAREKRKVERDEQALKDELERLQVALGSGGGEVSRLQVVDEHPESGCSETWENIKTTSRQLKGPLQNALQRNEQSNIRSGTRTGAFDPKMSRRLAVKDLAVNRQKIDSDEKQYSVIIVLDRSGTMRGRIRPAEVATGAFALALEEIGIDVAVVDLCQGDARMVKPFPADVRSKRDTLTSGVAHGGTPLSDALIVSRERVRQEPHYPFMFVVTDGMPNEKDRYLAELSDTQFPVLGVTLGADTTAKFDECYDVVRSATPDTVGDELVSLASRIMF